MTVAIIHLSGHPSLLGTMGDDSTSLGGKDWRGWAVGADMCVTARRVVITQ